MANEATPVEGPYEVHDFTCADGTAIDKHTVCKLTDPRTASATSGSGEAFAGIAASDKVESDGQTEIGCYTKGIFDMVVSAGASVSVGEWVTNSGANVIRPATEAEIQDGKAIGKALEAGSAAETIEVAIGIY